ncbi:hypothetical protein EV121DRAFT_214095 [Schizophyllum commune]
MPDMAALKPTSWIASRSTSHSASRTDPHAPSRSQGISPSSHTTSSSSSINLTQHSRLWYKDGKCMVIRAGNQLFRVPRDLLWRYANAFPIGEEGKENTYQGTPMVVLDEPSDDVEAFLLVYFNGSFVASLPGRSFSDAETYRIYAGIIRLSHIYHGMYWRRRALFFLAPMFPTELVHFDKVMRSDKKSRLWAAQGASRLVVDTARAVGANWLIPSAMLYLLSEHLRGSARSRIRKEERPMLIYYARLWQRCVADMFGPIGCAKCDVTLANFARKFLSAEFVFSMEIVWEEKSRVKKRMCSECKKPFDIRYKMHRKEFWGRLPAICGLGSWMVLAREMRRDTEEDEMYDPPIYGFM